MFFEKEQKVRIELLKGMGKSLSILGSNLEEDFDSFRIYERESGCDERVDSFGTITSVKQNLEFGSVGFAIEDLEVQQIGNLRSSLTQVILLAITAETIHCEVLVELLHVLLVVHLVLQERGELGVFSNSIPRQELVETDLVVVVHIDRLEQLFEISLRCLLS